MRCPACQVDNDANSDNCIACGKGLYALTRGTVVSSRYEILDAIGKGGMGVVYKARDLELDEVVALKVMRGDLTGSSEGARRFRSEIKLARKVSHSNVCRIHDYGREGHLTYIVMEFIAGTDLKQELRRRRGFEPGEALELILQVAHGLEAVHRQGVVHRDLKTPNIMRTADGTAKLMDFGIAKSFVGDAATGATATGLIVGTPEYMSPEQARAEPVDARSDIYALGIVLFELLTGELPFRGETPLATLFMQMQEPPPLEGPRAARIPPVVIPVLRRALAKNAADRHASVQEMAADLERARETLGVGRAAPAAATSPPSAVSTPRAQSAVPGVAVTPLPAPDLDATTPMPTPIPTEAPTVVPTPVSSPRVVAAPTPPPVVRQDPPPAPRPAPPPAVTAPPPAPAARATTPPPAVVRSAAPAAERASVQARYQPPRRSVPWVGWAGVGGLVVAVGVGMGLVMPRWGAEPATVPAAPQPSPSPEAAASAGIAVATPPVTTSPRVQPTPNMPSGAAALGSGPSALSTPRPAPSVPALTQPARPTAPARAEPSPTSPPPTLDLKPYPGPSPRSEAAPPPAGAGPAPTPAASAATVADPGSGASTAPEGPGALRIGVKPYAEVFVDGKSVGTTPLGAVTLAAGPHTVRLVHPAFQPLQRKVTIRPAETARLTVDLALDGIPK